MVTVILTPACADDDPLPEPTDAAVDAQDAEIPDARLPAPPQVDCPNAPFDCCPSVHCYTPSRWVGCIAAEDRYAVGDRFDLMCPCEVSGPYDPEAAGSAPGDCCYLAANHWDCNLSPCD